MLSQQPDFVDYTNNLSLFTDFFEFLETKSALPAEEIKSNLHMLANFFQHIVVEGTVSAIEEYVEEEWEKPLNSTSDSAEHDKAASIFVHNRAYNVFKFKDEFFCNQFAFTDDTSRYEGSAFTDETYTKKVSVNAKWPSFPIDPTNFEFKVKVIERNGIKELLLLPGEYQKLEELAQALGVELIIQNL